MSGPSTTLTAIGTAMRTPTTITSGPEPSVVKAGFVSLEDLHQRLSAAATLSAIGARHARTSRLLSEQRELRPEDSISRRNTPAPEQPPHVHDGAIENTRDCSRNDMIAHALTLIRLNAVAELLNILAEGDIEVGDRRYDHALTDTESLETLETAQSAIKELVEKMWNHHVTELMNHVTSQNVPEALWVKAADDIGDKLAGAIDDECRKLVAYWQDTREV